MEKRKKVYKVIFCISALLITVMIFYTLSWQRRTHILGSYELESNPDVTLYFTWDEPRYWAMETGSDGVKGEAISEGSYRLSERNNFLERNTFIFEDEIGNFESFSIKNGHLDIIVVIDGEDHIFRRTSGIHVSVNSGLLDS